MKYLIIRDDDLSYWTDKDELEEKYLPILENNFYVSFGVIAKSVKSFNLGCHDLFYQDFNQVNSISDNLNIIKFINKELIKDRIDILLHGYEHKYFFYSNDSELVLPATFDNLEFARSNNQEINFLGEFNIKQYSIDDYLLMLFEAGTILRNIFDIKINVFVPPSNQLCYNALKAVEIFKLNISGLYGKDSCKLLDNFLRVYYPFMYGLHFPFIYRNVTNQLTYHSLTTISNFDDLINKLEISSKLNAPFQLATHYWELDSHILDSLKEICRHAKKLGYISIKLSDFLNS